MEHIANVQPLSIRSIESFTMLTKQGPHILLRKPYPQMFDRHLPKDALLVSMPRREATLVPLLRPQILDSVIELSVVPLHGFRGFCGLKLQLRGFSIIYLLVDVVIYGRRASGGYSMEYRP